MRRLRANQGGFVFLLGRREKELLFETLKLYPLVPASHHRLSKTPDGDPAGENQRLLEESLAEQRRENQRRVLAWLNHPQRLRETKHGFELALAPAQIEWLLQVLNDVRVGSWLALGEPEAGEEPEVTEQNTRFLIALELCGLFESVLLAALGVTESPRWVGE